MKEDDNSQLFTSLMLLAQTFKTECSTLCMRIDDEEDIETVVKHVEMSYHDSIEIMNDIREIYSRNIEDDGIEIDFLYSVARALSKCIEAVYDTAKDFLRYNVLSFRDNVIPSMNTCENVADKMIDVAFELKKMNKDNYSFKTILDIERMINTGKSYYDDQMRTLFTTENDPVEIIKWEAIYKDFREDFECCDDFLMAVSLYSFHVLH